MDIPTLRLTLVAVLLWMLLDIRQYRLSMIEGAAQIDRAGLVISARKESLGSLKGGNQRNGRPTLRIP
jgi:hypothetical protein